ncbi:MAG: hypothetical protein AB1430_01360 [Pseudomonadota bacterium]
MSKTLSWTRSPAPHPVAALLRRAAATSLRTASHLLARLARRLRHADAAAPLHLPVVEFHASHREAGAPEGALYVDGELVGYVRGVERL